MIGNKHKATFILGLVSAGFFMSYPFQHTFMGGLFTSGFRAAMVGGLADWFAVSALFRRPLGIPFRTAIIPRNREKIVEALTEMVENEILMKENIKKQLGDWQVIGTLAQFITQPKGKSYLKKILYAFLKDIVAQIKTEEIVQIINHVLQHSKGKIKVSAYMADMLEWLMDNGYHEKVINGILDELLIRINQKKLQPLLLDIFVEVRKNYERGMSRRKFFNNVMNLSPMQVVNEVQHILESGVYKIKAADHPLRQQVDEWLTQFIIKVRTNEKLQENIDTWLQEKMIDQGYIVQEIAALYDQKYIDSKKIVGWLLLLLDHIDQFVLSYMTDEEKTTKLDHYLKTLLNDWIDIHHSKIGSIVKDSLQEFTNERLVNFIESKAGNDLQMIRINGSVVGGLVGMIIYLLTFWL